MMIAPLVSVVTPSLNQAKFLIENIHSVKNQGYSNLEHIVVDGGSEDDSIEILRQYEKEYQLKWISEPDSGQSNALNKGFLMARGKIIGWLNSDDVYLPDAVNTAVEFFDRYPQINWVYGDGYWIDEKGKVIRIYKSSEFRIVDLLIKGMYIPQPSIFFRRKVLDDVGFLDESIHTTMDYDFCVRLGKVHKAEYIPKVLAARRLQPAAKSISRTAEFCSDSIKVLEKFYQNPDLDDEVKGIKKRAFSQRYLVGAYRAFSAGQFEEARRFIFLSLKNDFRLLRKESIILPFLYFESLIKVKWITPGYSKRRAAKQFQESKGEVFVRWVED